jgi:hypothetical protein
MPRFGSKEWQPGRYRHMELKPLWEPCLKELSELRGKLEPGDGIQFLEGGRERG